MDSAATLVVGPSWVGDMVMAQALFSDLKRREPDRPIDVLAPAWSLPIVARMPEIRAGIAAETGHGEFGLSKRRRIGHELRGRYDRSIVLPRSWKSALIPWFARVPVRIGFKGESRYGLVNDIQAFDRARLDQTVKRYIALGREPDAALDDIPFPSLTVSEDNQQRVFDALHLAPTRPVVAFMPGAEYGPAKCWPHEQFAELAAELDEDGYDVWLLGSAKDEPAGARIAASGHASNLCGKTSLEDVIDVLGYVDHAVSNDSGLMHIAAAVGTHVHAIYGSSSPNFTPPLTGKRTIHWLDLDCSPCFKRECPLTHLRCLREITAGAVAEGVRAVDE